MGQKRATFEVTASRRRLRILSWVFTGVMALVLVAGPPIAHFAMGITVSPILSGSMQPYAGPDDVFVTIATKASNLQMGDIISVVSESSGTYYAHRIVDIRDQGESLRITTRGDANGSPEVDPLIVPAERSVQREFMKLDWIGMPLNFLTTEQGRQATLSLIVVTALIALFLGVSTKKARVAATFSEVQDHPAFLLANRRLRHKENELALFHDFAKKTYSAASRDQLRQGLNALHANWAEENKGIDRHE